MDKNYYVYEWFIVTTLEVFHVGKGTGIRRFTMNGRNKYFKRIYNKYQCAVRIYEQGLTEQEAYKLEKERIYELKLIGQAKTNFHEGGTGGNTYKYRTEEMRQKTHEKISKRLKGKKRPEHSMLLSSENSPLHKTVIMVDKNNNVINEWKSVKELEKHRFKGFPRPYGTVYVLKCLRKGHEFHGYYFRYK